MKVLYGYFIQFIDNMFVTKELLENEELMCKEYDKSKSKLYDLKNERNVVKNNICNRLNSIFDVKPKWYKKGFKMLDKDLHYEIALSKINHKSKEYNCLKYMVKKLQEKYYEKYEYGHIVKFNYFNDSLIIRNVVDEV